MKRFFHIVGVPLVFLLISSPLIMMLATCEISYHTKTFPLVSDLSLDELCGSKSGCHNVISFVIAEGDRTATIRNLHTNCVVRYRDGRKVVILSIEEATDWLDRQGFKSTGGRWIRENGTIVGNIMRAEIHD